MGEPAFQKPTHELEPIGEDWQISPVAVAWIDSECLVGDGLLEALAPGSFTTRENRIEYPRFGRVVLLNHGRGAAVPVVPSRYEDVQDAAEAHAMEGLHIDSIDPDTDVTALWESFFERGIRSMTADLRERAVGMAPKLMLSQDHGDPIMFRRSIYALADLFDPVDADNLPPIVLDHEVVADDAMRVDIFAVLGIHITPGIRASAAKALRDIAQTTVNYPDMQLDIADLRDIESICTLLEECLPEELEAVEIPDGVDPAIPMEFDPSDGQPLDGFTLPRGEEPMFPRSWDDSHSLYPKRWP